MHVSHTKRSIPAAAQVVPAQAMSLSDDLISAVYFGDESLTIRMGEKYRSDYQAGPCVLVTPNQVRIEVTLKEPIGCKTIGQLTAEELSRNGYPISLNPSPEELQHARQLTAESMKHWYPKQNHRGLDTEVFCFGFKSPKETPQLREIREALDRKIRTHLPVTRVQFFFVPSADLEKCPHEIQIGFHSKNLSLSQRDAFLREVNEVCGTEDIYRAKLGESPRATAVKGQGTWSFKEGASKGFFGIACDVDAMARGVRLAN